MQRNEDTKPSVPTKVMQLAKEDTQPMQTTQRLTVPKSKGGAGASAPRPFGYLFLWLLTGISILLNLVILRQMLIARQAALQAISDAIVVIDNLQNQTFTQTVRVDDMLDVNTTLPISETIPVTIKETLPVNDTVMIKVLGVDVPVTIEANLPVELSFDLVIDQNFRASASVPLELEVPIQVSIGDTPLYDTLDEVKARLELLADKLDSPFLPSPDTETPAP